MSLISNIKQGSLHFLNGCKGIILFLQDPISLNDSCAGEAISYAGYLSVWPTARMCLKKYIKNK